VAATSRNKEVIALSLSEFVAQMGAKVISYDLVPEPCNEFLVVINSEFQGHTYLDKWLISHDRLKRKVFQHAD
jgi:hypothetical protein